MIGFTKDKQGKNKMFVWSKTPLKKDYPYLNRQQRRKLIYSGPRKMKALFLRIIELRKDMRTADIKVPHLPKRRNSKVLSGYMGMLTQLARESVRD